MIIYVHFTCQKIIQCRVTPQMYPSTSKNKHVSAPGLFLYIFQELSLASRFPSVHFLTPSFLLSESAALSPRETKDTSLAVSSVQHTKLSHAPGTRHCILSLSLTVITFTSHLNVLTVWERKREIYCTPQQGWG